MKKRRAITAFGLALAMLLTAGCGGAENGKEVSKEELDASSPSSALAGTEAGASAGGRAMGRFLESNIRPGDVENICDVREGSDGKLYLLGTKGDRVLELSSTDYGQTWAMEPGEIMKLSLDEEDVFGAVLAPDGGAFVSLMNYQEFMGETDGAEMAEEEVTGSGFHYYMIPPGEEGREVVLPDTVSHVASDSFLFAEDGSLYGKGDRAIYCLDPLSGELQKTCEVGTEYIMDFGVLGDAFYVYGESLEFYDRESGELLEVPSVLNEQLAGFKSTSIFCTLGEQELYFANEGGIYRYVRGGSVVEQVVNSALNSLSSPDFYTGKVRAFSDGSLAVSGYEAGNGPALYRYVYDANTPTLPETELKVYSLEDNSLLRQAISLYQKSHPDVYVTLEIGLSGDDGVTASDALRTLNTNIMSGNGPDVLTLDGMSWKNYQEKGLLADVSALVDEVAGSDGLFTNVVDAYRSDGNIFAVPTHFALPAILGPESSVDSAVSLSGLVSQASLADAEHTLLGKRSMEELVEALTAGCQNSWQNEDGSLNEEAIREFLQAVQTLAAADGLDSAQAEDNDEVLYEGTYISPSNYMDSEIDLSMLSMEYVGGEQKLHLGQIQGIDDFSNLVSTAGAVAGSSYALFEGQGGPVFVPQMVVGISSQSREPETALDFLRYLLSEECQSVQGKGFPVNRRAYEASKANMEEIYAMVGVMDEEGNSIDLALRRPTEDEFAWLDAQLMSVSAAADDDQVKRETIGNACESLRTGSLEEALAQVLQTLQIYLSE